MVTIILKEDWIWFYWGATKLLIVLLSSKDLWGAAFWFPTNLRELNIDRDLGSFDRGEQFQNLILIYQVLKKQYEEKP